MTHDNLQSAQEFYLGGPYHDGTYSICEVATGRVRHVFNPATDDHHVEGDRHQSRGVNTRNGVKVSGGLPVTPARIPSGNAPMEGEPTEYYDWLLQAREIAAQCWRDDETKHLVMELALAEAVARRIAAWMQTGAQHARNEEYWRDRALKAEAAPIVQGEHILIRLKRPEGYENVHPELVMEDVGINPAFQPEIVAAPIVPQKWKLVPMEPTEQMLRDGQWAGFGCQVADPDGGPAGEIYAMWSAMLAASPALNPTDAEMVCYEAYQVVGSLLSDLGKFETPEARKILDNLSQAKLIHRDVLPWSSYVSSASLAQAARRADIAARLPEPDDERD